MTPLHSSKLKLSACAAGIFAIGCLAGAMNLRIERNRATAELLHHAETAALAFDGEELRRLSASSSDLGSPAYRTAKRRLQQLKSTHPEARYVYLFRTSGAPAVTVFLADSTPEGAKDESLPGDVYPEASRSPGLQEILRTSQPVMEGPLSDSFGTWVTGYARINGEAAGTDAIHVLGVDIAANRWTRNLWVAAARAALYTWTLLGFPLFAYVTARREGEQREAIRNLSEAVEQSPSAIMILDLGHRIEYANRGLCQQIGYPRRELIGRHWRDFIVGPAAGPTVADIMVTIDAGHTWEGEWTNQRKDGTAYPVHGRVTPVKQRDGSTACFVALFDDVTDAKRKEAELREARDLAEAGDRAKGHFLATMSHEVRTPLNGIVGFTSLLLETPLTAEQREFVQTIRASGEALIQLTGDILDFARIESGKLKLDPIVCDPRDCIEEALDLHAAKAAEKGLDLLHHANADVPSAVIVDGGRLRQVLVNLIGNAVKFTESGQVAVRVRLREGNAVPGGVHSDAANSVSTPRACVLEFSIRDTGIGITPEQQARLFRPFTQVDASTTRRYGGAGLGLAICKNLVQLMGGTISVSSTAGAGSTFSFTISVPVTAAEPPARDLDGMRVSIAIPSRALREEMAELLGTWNARVDAFAEAAQLAGVAYDMALVEVSEPFAQELAAGTARLPGLPHDQTLAIVPISLSTDLRNALRTHFRFLINRPLHHGPLFAMLSGARPSSGAAAAPATQFGFRVLVVEDNDVNQRLLQRVLASQGCTAHVAANGVEAVRELSQRADQYDLVLLDLHMPEMDGLAALEHIRRGDAGPRAQTIWVIALTADVRPEQRERGFAAGLNDYLTKPLRAAELEAALHRFRGEKLSRRA